MEFINGFLIACINFYGVLRQPNIKNTSDALYFWNNGFQSRRLKAVHAMIANLLETRDVDLNSVRDKELAANYIAEYIQRIILLFDKKFKKIGSYSDLCQRNKYTLDITNEDNMDQVFIKYLNGFLDKNNCNKCKIKLFINKHESEISKIKSAQNLEIADSKKSGFERLIKEIESINQSHISCKKCNAIGDLIISLITPVNMRIEHTDYSYDFLSEILAKEHFRHPSETEILKSK